ncbi:MAG TPA: hypothetical protein VMC85_17500 [Desulfomonilaceae bacterium]|nr:hypothetical protein [Desulfomonilaceae bacterium]
MPTKQGRLVALTKHIAAYVEEVPRAWDAYLKEKDKGTEQGRAERAAMRSVHPGDNNTGVRLDTWKKHKLCGPRLQQRKSKEPVQLSGHDSPEVSNRIKPSRTR